MSRAIRPLAVLLSISLLSACGGSNNDDENVAPTPTPQRGELLESPPTKLASYSPDDLVALLGTSEFSDVLLELLLTPKCAIDVHQLEYQTVDPQGTLTPASGTLMIPNDSDPECQGARPIVVYAPPIPNLNR